MIKINDVFSESYIINVIKLFLVEGLSIYEIDRDIMGDEFATGVGELATVF